MLGDQREQWVSISLHKCTSNAPTHFYLRTENIQLHIHCNSFKCVVSNAIVMKGQCIIHSYLVHFEKVQKRFSVPCQLFSNPSMLTYIFSSKWEPILRHQNFNEQIFIKIALSLKILANLLGYSLLLNHM